MLAAAVARENWLMSVLVRVEVEDWKGKPRFELFSPENGPAGSADSGDGTVPFRGACPGFRLTEQRLAIKHLRSDFSADFWGHPVPGVQKHDGRIGSRSGR